MHGWLSTGEVESGSSARIWVSPERARWVREDHPGGHRAVGRRADLRAHVRLVRVARPRDPQGGGRRGGARAGGGAHAPCWRPRSSLPSRRSQIEMSDEEVRGFLAEKMVMQCATNGPRGLPHMVAAVVRRRCRRAARLDLREVAEGAQPGARPARDARPRRGRAVPRAARRDVRVRRARSSATRPKVEQFGLELFARYAGELDRRHPRDGREAGAEASRAHVRPDSYGELGPP